MGSREGWAVVGLWVLAGSAWVLPGLRSWIRSGPIEPPALRVTGYSPSGEPLLTWSPREGRFLGDEAWTEGLPVEGWEGLLLGNPLDINHADVQDFEALPGIGPVTARAIVAFRENRGRFSSLEELLDVSGIGPATLARLRPWLCIRVPDPSGSPR